MTRFFSSNPSKAWSEKFFLLYAPFWILWFVLIIYFEWYIDANKWLWIYFTLPMTLVCVLGPLVFQPASDRNRPFFQRFWVKCNVWIGIFNFVGNYFWTHYFFQLLGAKYLMDAHKLNGIPLLCFFATQAYFTFYFSLTNVIQRALLTSIKDVTMRRVSYIVLVAVLSYVTAFMETFTIQNFQYYTFDDRGRMYSIGSAFYAIYFIVGFPMFYRLEEYEKRWSISRVAVDALGASMLVTILLDFWRLAIGSINNVNNMNATVKVPWIF